MKTKYVTFYLQTDAAELKISGFFIPRILIRRLNPTLQYQQYNWTADGSVVLMYCITMVQLTAFWLHASTFFSSIFSPKQVLVFNNSDSCDITWVSDFTLLSYALVFPEIYRQTLMCKMNTDLTFGLWCRSQDKPCVCPVCGCMWKRQQWNAWEESNFPPDFNSELFLWCWCEVKTQS